MTHGLDVRPLATALRASIPAPSMTVGLEVFVHEVIAAITTCPWSSSVSVPSSSVTGTETSTRSATCRPPVPPSAGWGSGERSLRPLWSPEDGGSEDGKDSALASSWSASPSFGSSTSSGSRSSSASRKAALDSVSETRSCGRFGPASEGTTSERSSSSVSE